MRRRDSDFVCVLIKAEVAAPFALKSRSPRQLFEKVLVSVDAIFNCLLGHVVGNCFEPRIFGGVSEHGEFFAQVKVAGELFVGLVSVDFLMQCPIVSETSRARKLKQARSLAIVRYEHDFKRLQHFVHRRTV